MKETKRNSKGIIGILNRARLYNSEIGDYVEHFINEQFNYSVRLTNGRIIIPLAMAQDQEFQPAIITEERLQRLANTFQNNKHDKKNPIIPNNISKEIKVTSKLSIGQKISKIMGKK